MRFLLLPLLFVATGCMTARSPDASSEAEPTATLAGTVTYRVRIALPPDAVVTVRLLDVSLADAPSTVIAEQMIPVDGRSVPIPFALAYDADQIEARRRYVVRAEIHDAEGALRWTTDTAFPVLTNGAPSDGVEVRVVQVDTSAQQSGGGGTLMGSEWRLVHIVRPDGGAETPGSDEALTITFEADGGFRGRADCNTHRGQYTLHDDGRLDIRQAVTTRAACRPPSLGDAFVRALTGADRVGIDGDRMSIQGPGATLVFERATVMGMAPQPTGQTHVYECASEGFAFTIRTGPGEIALWLPERFDNRYLVLGQVRAASGAKYQDGDVMVWTKGAEAALAIGGESFAGCRATS